MRRHYLKATSAEAAASYFQAALVEPVVLPEHLTVPPQVQPYATSILRSHSSHHWRCQPWLLPLVAQLAHAMHQIQHEGAALARGGAYLNDPTTGKKTTRNASVFLVADAFRTQAKLLRALSIVVPVSPAAPKRKRVTLDDPSPLLADPC